MSARRSREERVKDLGREAGFDPVRIARATTMHVERARYLDWVKSGRQAEMGWMTPERARRSSDPTTVIPEARSVISVGLAYWAGSRPGDRSNTGRVARYAWGKDYHLVLGERLERVVSSLRRDIGGEHRWYVDTGPMMDKALAARSGLGWYGKNTNILTERYGSFVLLGEIITTLDLEPDQPLTRDCGACRLCLVACPTGALGPQYSIDSGRCISYLTIEHRGPIPRELRPLMGNWVYGCDICQDVCPPAMAPYLDTAGARRAWAGEVRRMTGRTGQENAGRQPEQRQRERIADHPLYPNGTRAQLDLVELLRLSHQAYVEAFRGTAIKRAKVWMLRRNAAIALGNVGEPDCRIALVEAMERDEHPTVRGHAAWALARIGIRHNLMPVADDLRAALEVERETDVREEISLALQDVAGVGH